MTVGFSVFLAGAQTTAGTVNGESETQEKKKGVELRFTGGEAFEGAVVLTGEEVEDAGQATDAVFGSDFTAR